MTSDHKEALERLPRLMVEMTDVARLLQKALDTGHAQGLLYDSVLPCMNELTTHVPVLIAEREGLERKLELAFRAGWNAHETGLESAEDGPAVGFRMFLRSFNFGDEEQGEDLTLPGAST